MMYSKVLALLSLAIVSNANTVCQDEVHIKSAADLETISGCYSSLTMSSTDIVNADLSRLSEVTDELHISNNTQLTSILLPNLKSVETLEIEGNHILAALNLDSLASATTIEIEDAVHLSSLNLPSLEKLTNLHVTNTGIDSLAVIAKFSEFDEFVVTANTHLKEINFANLTTLNGKLSITNNNFDFHFSAPKLTSTDGDFSINNVTSLSLPNLAVVKGDLDFSYNFFNNLTISNVTSIGKTLSIIGNSKLANITFPALENLGGALFISNNSALHDVDGFDKLTNIKGALEIHGPVANLTLPELKQIAGATIIKSSVDLDCAAALKVLQPITGSTKCICDAVKPAANETHGSDKDKSSSDNKDKSSSDNKDKNSSDDSDKDKHKNSASLVSGGYALVAALAVCLFM